MASGAASDWKQGKYNSEASVNSQTGVAHVPHNGGARIEGPVFRWRVLGPGFCPICDYASGWIGEGCGVSQE